MRNASSKSSSAFYDSLIGFCLNCDERLHGDKPKLFCSEFCSDTAKDVRYFRRCHADGRAKDPDVRRALLTRLAHHNAGGYRARTRALSPFIRIEILAENGGLCCACGIEKAVEVDHIQGSSNERSNLQGLCAKCHQRKTSSRIVISKDEGVAARQNAFLSRVAATSASRPCDDHVEWPRIWRDVWARARTVWNRKSR